MQPEVEREPKSANAEAAPLLRIELEGLASFDEVKKLIYSRMQELHAARQHVTHLELTTDIYEILNKRLVFKTAAHKELPHLITPYGNLVVEPPAQSGELTICFK